MLRADGIDVLTTREPGGTEIGERIRAVLLDSRTAGLDPWAEMALMFASRAQQIAQVILPALDSGRWVLCDRFTDSTEAYQGGGRQLGSDAVLQVHEVLCRGLVARPHDPDGFGRRSQREARTPSQPGGGRWRLSLTRIASSRKAMRSSPGCEDAFLAIAKREPQRVAMVDARRPAEVVHPEIVRIVRERLLTRQTRIRDPDAHHHAGREL